MVGPRARIARLFARSSGSRGPALAALAMLVPLLVLVPRTAQAHFTLDYPPDQIIPSDTLGDPQKAAPCGTDSASGPGTPSGDVTTFAPGQQVTLKFSETVAHDGWYRISISYKDGADLTDPPYATYSSGLEMGWSYDAGIEDPPVPPVVLDGVDKHLASSETTLPNPWTATLTIPTEPCAKCILQVEEIMLQHPVNQADGPFTYHHCANIVIAAGGDGGTIAMGADGGIKIVTLDSGSTDTTGGASSGSQDGTSSGTTTGTGTTGTGTEDSDGGSAAGNGSGGSASDNGSSSGSSGGCDASGRETSGVACLGLLAGAIAAGLQRRRRAKS